MPNDSLLDDKCAEAYEAWEGLPLDIDDETRTKAFDRYESLSQQRRALLR